MQNLQVTHGRKVADNSFITPILIIKIMEITVIMKDGTKKLFTVNVGDSIVDINNELTIEFADKWLRWE